MATQDLAAADLVVRVLNEDDNLPAFGDPTVYYFVYNPLHSSNRGRYPAVGRVRATDADGDALLYRVRGAAEGPSAALRGGGCCIVVPQTGQVIVVNGEFNATVLDVDAVERDNKVSQALYNAHLTDSLPCPSNTVHTRHFRTSDTHYQFYNVEF